MSIKVLNDNVISRIRSSCHISNVLQCVIELVLNSVDAKSTAIAIRIDLELSRIQVIDNGIGIGRNDLKSAGERYMTSKFRNLSDFEKNTKYYGYRGEALACICRLSKFVQIITKHCDETSCKTIGEDGSFKITSVKERPSVGTTVTVEEFLGNVPVRQHYNNPFILDDIKRNLQSLAIINPKISLSLRNNVTGEIVFQSPKNINIALAFKSFHDIDVNGFHLFKVHKENMKIETLLHADCHGNSKLQYVYVNKRPVVCPKINNFVCQLLPQKYPIFLINIQCPLSNVNIEMSASKTVAHFKEFEALSLGLKKMINAFLDKGTSIISSTVANNNNEIVVVKRDYGLSQVAGAVKGVAFKRQHTHPSIERAEKKLKSNSEQLIVSSGAFNDSTYRTHGRNHLQFCDEMNGKQFMMSKFMNSIKKHNEQAFVEPSFDQTLRDIDEEDLAIGNNVPKQPYLQKPNEKPAQPVFNEDATCSIGIQTNAECGIISERSPLISRNVKISDRPVMRKMYEKSPQVRYRSNKIDYHPLVICNNFQTNETGCPSDIQTIYRREEFGELEKTSLECVQLSPIPRYCQTIEGILKYCIQLNKIDDDKSKMNKASISLKSFIYDEKFKFEPTPFANGENAIKINSSSTSRFFTPIPTPGVFNFPETINKYNVKSLNNISSRQEASNNISPFALEDTETIRGSNRTNYNVEMEKKTTSITQSKWTRDTNMFGRKFYTNKLTGLALFSTPRTEKKKFDFALRFDFMPKGSSPVLKDFGTIDSLTPHTKENLQNAFVESYEDELLLIKWRNYIQNGDPKTFFDEIYTEKSKLFENLIPNIDKRPLRKFQSETTNNNQRFTKALFEDLEIIGQLDCKFIVVHQRHSKLLLLFDQHAVHERIRLELLMEGYKRSSTKLEHKLAIFLPHSDLALIEKQSLNLSKFGLIFDVLTNGINVDQVPTCIYNKFIRGENLNELIQSLIREILSILKSNNGILMWMPQIIQNIINSEACRGAIKFGDKLTKLECSMHLYNLSRCTLPFQCAHGRPTVSPLIFLENNTNISTKLNLRRLKKVNNKCEI